MNPPQFFAEMKRPNVGVLLGAFATSGWLSLQAIAILWAALEAMVCGIKQFVRTMALRKTHAPVIPNRLRGLGAKVKLTEYDHKTPRAESHMGLLLPTR
jgi:hypothetical protein